MEGWSMSACGVERAERLADYDREDCLIYGIGNVGRQDDGLGWALIDWLEKTGRCARAEVARCYQLQLEDADRISHMRRVLFVDATRVADVDDLRVEAVDPRMDPSFTSHAVSVPTIVAICECCFGRAPAVQLLTIKGYAWAFKIGLTGHAARNLGKAKALFRGETQ
jgi:hydrogenase maturation protease